MMRRIGFAENARTAGWRDFWDLPGSMQAEGNGVLKLPPRTTFLGLCPFLTTPNVLIGCHVPGGGPAFALRPGSVIPIAKDTRDVQLFNAIVAAGFPAVNGVNNEFPRGLGTATQVTAYGRAALIAGIDEPPSTWDAYVRGIQDRTAGYSRASRLMDVDMALNETCALATLGVKRLRINVRCLNAGGAVIAAPADLAVTLRLGHAEGPDNMEGVYDAFGAYPNLPAAWSMHYDSTRDITISQFITAKEVDVTQDMALIVKAQAVAGTAVARLRLRIDGD